MTQNESIKTFKDAWSYFDAIRCINLVTRQDRLDLCSKVFQKYDIPVKYYHPQKHPTNPTQGCFESHINLISEAYDQGCQNILIFEDDIIDNSKIITLDALYLAIDFMKKNNTWDLFFLGSRPIIEMNSIKRIKKGNGASIIKLKSTCCHAYILSRRMMEKMYRMKYAGAEIDYIYIRNRDSYAIYPSFFYQRESDSDLGGVGFIGKNYAMSALETYAYYVNVPLVIIIPLMLILIILLLLAEVNIFVILIIIIALLIVISFAPHSSVCYDENIDDLDPENNV